MNKFCRFFIVMSLLFASFELNAAGKWEAEEAKARLLYDAGKYDQSIALFREIMLSSDNETIKTEAYFWLAKAYISVEKYAQAMTNIDYYLANCAANGANYPEAVYQKGVILYLQQSYEDSYNQLVIFVKNYKKNPLVSSAYYWMGQAMYCLGRLDDAQLYFGIVVKKFPKSAKFQAAQYKLELIELKRSEFVLQNLLKWSQEQYLANLNANKIKEKSLMEALEQYRSKSETPLNPTQEELESLRRENEQLVNVVTQLTKERDNALAVVNGEKTFREKLDEIKMQEQLLLQKEETLRSLQKDADK